MSVERGAETFESMNIISAQHIPGPYTHIICSQNTFGYSKFGLIAFSLWREIEMRPSSIRVEDEMC